jgi:hypothetical protein
MTDQASSSIGSDRVRRRDPRPRRVALLGIAVALVLGVSGVALAANSAFIGPFNTVSTLASTVPGNGDQNPYGIVAVPRSSGLLVAGQLLISNFNNSANLQGTGTTIDEISAGGSAGSAHLFAQINPAHLPGPCPGGVGLTTALAALPNGYVVVGSLPTSDGMSDTAQAGCLLILNSFGRVVETIAGGPIDGPWDMTSVTTGPITTLFVANVVTKTITSTAAPRGTVVRIRLLTLPGVAPIRLTEDVIAAGFATRTDPGALVIGPTGLALSPSGTLYVADTLSNRIAAIPDAMFRFFPVLGGFTVTSGGFLNGPLGLTIAPNNDILTANAGDGNIVETTPEGQQLVAKTADSATGAGSLFGLIPTTNGVLFVDDGDNTLKLLN